MSTYDQPVTRRFSLIRSYAIVTQQRISTVVLGRSRTNMIQGTINKQQSEPLDPIVAKKTTDNCTDP
jgi:hypothetical protein